MVDNGGDLLYRDLATKPFSAVKFKGIGETEKLSVSIFLIYFSEA